jgi:hypothetical protein
MASFTQDKDSIHTISDTVKENRIKKEGFPSFYLRYLFQLLPLPHNLTAPVLPIFLSSKPAPKRLANSTIVNPGFVLTREEESHSLKLILDFEGFEGVDPKTDQLDAAIEFHGLPEHLGEDLGLEILGFVISRLGEGTSHFAIAERIELINNVSSDRSIPTKVGMIFFDQLTEKTLSFVQAQIVAEILHIHSLSLS